MSIEDEARAEAERRFPMSLASEYGSGDAVILTRIDFVKGAAWASQREPTDAEIEAAAPAIQSVEFLGVPWDAWGETSQNQWRKEARAALSARNTRETNE